LAQTSEVDVWLVSLESEGQRILSPDEEQRAARFRFEADRARWIRARSALRSILGHSSGIPAAEIRFSLGPHGKPAIAQGGGVEFNLSHSGAWAMIAVSREVPVGIDIEHIREKVDMKVLLARLGERNLPDGETDLYRAWTRREAMTKAAGCGLLEAPVGDFRVCELEAPTGYCASVALIGRDPRVRRHALCAHHSSLVPSAGTE
jgi:4'-phosphopantetheinyl transferase